MPLSQFLSSFRAAFGSGELLKCTLSKPSRFAPQGLKNVYIRPVALKKGIRAAFNFRYETRDEVKNYEPDEALDRLKELLGKSFLNADLFTTERDYHISFSKNGEAVFSSKKAKHAAPASQEHDRAKHRLIDPTAPWLHALGITNTKGEVSAGAHDKWRQINKYLEIIDNLLRECPLPEDARIADMGSGKGYLTFALYDYLKNKTGMEPQITGIELRQNLVDLCNGTAQSAGFQGLHFVAKNIEDFRPDRLDMLIALHACDTATDLALAAGIRNGAKIIVVAPCCHKQIRKDMKTRNELAPVLRYGILEERQAEIITDGIRALLLEAEGYKTRVFEFISTEHTAKNVMITATAVSPSRFSRNGEKDKADVREIRSGEKRRAEALARVAALKAGFGIAEHYLERLL